MTTILGAALLALRALHPEPQPLPEHKQAPLTDEQCAGADDMSDAA